MKPILINLVVFKAGWLACVMLAARDLPVAATVAVGALVAFHLTRVPVPVKEALFLSVAGLLGLAWETLLLGYGMVQYPASSAAGGLAPHWIVALWVLFATTIGHGFAWIKRRWTYAALLGLAGGPLAFAAGAGMGAAVLPDPLTALMVIGLGWALMLPLLALISDTIIDAAFLEPKENPVRFVEGAPRIARQLRRDIQDRA